MAVRNEEESIAIPQTPLLSGRETMPGESRSRIFTRSRLICALTVIFVIVFLIAVILIAVRAGEGSHEEVLVEEQSHAQGATPGTEPPPCREIDPQTAQQTQDDINLTPEDLVKLRALLDMIHDPAAATNMIKQKQDELDEDTAKKELLVLLSDPRKLEELVADLDEREQEKIRDTLEQYRSKLATSTPSSLDEELRTPKAAESRRQSFLDDPFFDNDQSSGDFDSMNSFLNARTTTWSPKAPNPKTDAWNLLARIPAEEVSIETTTQAKTTKQDNIKNRRATDIFRVMESFQLPNDEDRIVTDQEFLNNSWQEPSDSQAGKVEYEELLSLADVAEATDMEDIDLQSVYARTGKAAITSGLARSNGECAPEEEECADGNGCFLMDEKCDRIIHCADKSDENDCSCRSYLSTDKICDEYPDCDNGEDESNCGCPLGQFNCGIETRCISEDKVCDNVFDCENGLDEAECAALAPISGGLLNPNVTGSPYIDGLLYWKVGGGFHPLCVDFPEPGLADDYFTMMAEDICDSLLPGMMSELPQINVISDLEKIGHFENVAHLHLETVEKQSDENAKFPGGQFEFSLSPPDDHSVMVEIRCPTPRCGTRASVRPAVAAQPIPTEPTEVEGTTPAAVINDKIVGGSAADAKNWPAIVAIYRDGDFICGGTIIDAEWVLTAAHCVENYKENQYYFDVLVGMLRKNSKSSLQYSRKVVKVVVHEEFDSVYLKNDLAMIKVDKPFIFNAYAGLACMPEDATMSPQPDDVCFAAGWGNKREDRDPAEHLQEVQIPIMENCKKDYNNIEVQICGGRHEGGIDSCQGDSGGPLFCQYPGDSSRWYLGGIISHGEGCARSDTPGVYTRAFAYKEWVKEKLAEDASRAPGTGVELEPRMECPTHVCDGKCRKKHELCNRFVDCMDQTDEMWCSKNNEDQIVFSPPSDHVPTHKTSPFVSERQSMERGVSYHPIIHYTSSKTCKFDYFRCTTVHQCIPKTKTCDQVPDCVDFSDERDCNCLAFLARKWPDRVCDGYPDCKSWEDERNCKFCSTPDSFYCDISKQCIPRHKVCDTNADCKFKEDERYCFTLINTDSVFLQQDGRPRKQTKGVVAFSSKGLWAASCVQKWDGSLSDQICRYMGYKASITQTLHSSDSLPHLKGKVLKTRFVDSVPPVFPRSYGAFIGEEETTTERALVKRQAYNGACSFVNLECSETAACGIMPLYDRLGEHAPLSGAGVFPWQVTIYKQGQYLCGGTLVHQYWVLTSTACADQVNIKDGDYIIARAGGHREQFSLSAHDQLRRVVQFTTIPGTSISMGFLSKSFNLNEYVNIVCIPSVTWVPVNRTCYLTGRFNGVLNHAYETTVESVCDYISSRKYSFCTRQRIPTNECLENWSGALVCSDKSGTYYAVGGYFSQNANCKFGQEPAPDRFETLVSKAAREGITSVIQSAQTANHPFENLRDDCDTLRCPLGRCLSPHEICDGVVHCSNMVDEDSILCANTIRMCEKVNATHCECQSQDFMCGNGMCLDKTKFCNGVNDCGDNPSSDETPNCKTCSVALKTLKPKSICDGHVDCLGKNDIGQDESATECCPGLQGPNRTMSGEDPYRCVIGHLDPSSHSSNKISISDDCIPSSGVCDWDTNSTIPSCPNGADELDCISIWPQYHVKDHPRDAFGRFISVPKGYLYFVAFGKKYLYCAGLQSFKPSLLFAFGDVLCKYKGFRAVLSINLSEPQSRTRVAPNVPLTSEEQAHFEACQLVYLTCNQW